MCTSLINYKCTVIFAQFDWYRTTNSPSCPTINQCLLDRSSKETIDISPMETNNATVISSHSKSLAPSQDSTSKSYPQVDRCWLEIHQAWVNRLKMPETPAIFQLSFVSTRLPTKMAQIFQLSSCQHRSPSALPASPLLLRPNTWSCCRVSAASCNAQEKTWYEVFLEVKWFSDVKWFSMV